MAQLTVQNVTRTGTNPNFVAADAANDTFFNQGSTFVHIKNGSAASVDVTVPSPQKCNQGFNHDLVITVAANGEEIVGPFPSERFADPDTGNTTLQYSAAASVTVGVFKI